MKISLYSLLIITTFLFSCNVDQEIQDQTADNAGLIKSKELRGGSEYICDPDYIFDVLRPREDPGNHYVTMEITYHPDLSLDEIHCVRYEYFTGGFFIDIQMCSEQPEDPYQDCWKYYPGWPDQTTNTTICDDPRTTNGNCDDN